MQRDASRGWAHTFLTQMEEVLGTCVDRGIKVVTNAGGLNPAGPGRPGAGRSPTGSASTVAVAHVEGDDLLPRIGELQAAGHPLAHLDTGQPLEPGRRARWSRPTPTWAPGPSSRPCAAGADVVVCPRVTDASLVVGPAAWHHGWARDGLGRAGRRGGGRPRDRVRPPGHRGQLRLLHRGPRPRAPGLPHRRGGRRRVVGHHQAPGHRRRGRRVGTVTAQLLYEIGGHHYPNTDVVARFDTVEVDEVGPDRVRLSGTRGPARAAGRQGLLQPARRLAQLDDLRPDRPRHRGQGRPDRARPWTSALGGTGQLRRVRRPPDPLRQARRADQRARPPPSCG